MQEQTGTPGESVDGRTARAVRTRAVIVDAHIGLLRDGDMRPTGKRIAERAGVSLRTLWTNFKDMETLYAATGERMIELQLDAYRPIPVDLALPERVDAYCAQRMRMLTILTPAARAAATLEPFSAQLRRNRSIEIGRVRDEINALFAPELGAAGPDREELLNGVLAAVTFATWSVLVDQLGLAPESARAVMVRTVTALLTNRT